MKIVRDMGLDMYLFKMKRVSTNFQPFNPKSVKDVSNYEQAYYESTKHQEVWERQMVKQWCGEETLHNYFCKYTNYEIGPAPLRITETIASKLLEDINSVLEDHTKVKTIFPTKCSPSNNYGCEKHYYEEEYNLDSFFETLSGLKPLVEKILSDLNNDEEVITYEYDCWY